MLFYDMKQTSDKTELIENKCQHFDRRETKQAPFHINMDYLYK